MQGLSKTEGSKKRNYYVALWELQDPVLFGAWRILGTNDDDISASAASILIILYKIVSFYPSSSRVFQKVLAFWNCDMKPPLQNPFCFSSKDRLNNQLQTRV